MELYELLGFESDRCIFNWVRLIAKRTLRNIPPTAYEFEDMVSIGLFALCRAKAHHVEDRNDSFQGFCYIKVRGAILDEIRRCAKAYKRKSGIEHALYLNSQGESSPTPEKTVLQLEMKRELYKHVNELSSLERSVVLQCLVLDKKNEEIAKWHGRATRSFASKVMRKVRDRLREPLKSAGVDEYLVTA